MSWFFDAGLDLAGHPGDRRNAVAAFAHGALGAAERRVAGIGIDVLPGAVVGRVEDQRVLVEAERAELVHDAADAGVELDDRIGVFALGHRLVDEVGCGMFGWCTFMKLTLMKNGSRRLRRCDRETRAPPSRRSRRRTECRRRPCLAGRVDVLAVDLEVLLRAGSPALPDSAPLVTCWNIARSSGSMSGNQVGSA